MRIKNSSWWQKRGIVSTSVWIVFRRRYTGGGGVGGYLKCLKLMWSLARQYALFYAMQEMVCRWCAQGVWRDHSFLPCCKTLQTVVKWSCSEVYWLMLERTTATLMEENYSYSDISFFVGGKNEKKTKNQIFHKNMFQDGNQLTEGPSSPLGPLKKRERKKGRLLMWAWQLLPYKSLIWTEMTRGHCILLSIKWIAYIIASLYSQFLLVNHTHIVLPVPMLTGALLKMTDNPILLCISPP